MDSAMSLYQLPDKPSDAIFQALILQAEALCSKEQRLNISIVLRLYFW